MSLLTALGFKKQLSTLPKQIVSEKWEERSSVKKPEVNLFCWKRPVDHLMMDYLAEVLDRDLPAIRCYMQVKNLSQQIAEVRKEWELQKTQASEVFWQDVEQIARDFLAFSKDGAGVVHLKIVRDDSCRKFHVDGYTLRLFSTYLGRGTEWLPEEAVDRSALGVNNQLIVKDQSLVQRMNAFDVGILKGELPQVRHGVKGIVHRSPEISHIGERRIILRIDI